MMQKDQWLEQLYRDTFPHVARLINKMGGDLDTAKDIFQDALIIYLEKQTAGTLNIQTTPTAYISGIAKILWLKKYNSDKQFLSFGELPQELSSIDDMYVHSDERTEHVMKQVMSAGKKCLQLLQAFYYDRLPMQQIATIFNYRSTRSATVQKYKCIEKIREQVNQTNGHEKIAA